MAEQGGVRRTFYRGVEFFGQKAAQLAQKAQERLKTLNAQQEIEELRAKVTAAAREAWQQGHLLPENLIILLSELNRLEEMYGTEETEEETAIEEETPDAGRDN